MKPPCNQIQVGAALLPTVITAIILRLGTFGKKNAPTHVRLKATAERFIARNRHDLPPQRQ